MNANTMRMAFGIYLVTALLGIPTIHAASPIKALESRVTENEADISANSALIADHEARITTNGSDINANSVLIDDNTIRINALRPSVSVRANGERIGTYLTTIDSGSNTRPTQVTVMNDNEYLFNICLDTGECDTTNEGGLMPPTNGQFANIFVYRSADCSGQAYFMEQELVDIQGLGSLLKGSGYVFDTAGGIYYLPINTTPIRDEVLSSKPVGGNICGDPPSIPQRPMLYAVFPNDDPSVTGVSTSSFALPLSLGF